MACEFHIVGSWLLKIQLWIAWFHSPGTVVQELFAYFACFFGQSSNHRMFHPEREPTFLGFTGGFQQLLNESQRDLLVVSFQSRPVSCRGLERI